LHIVSIINQKGGCGKTTTAINLAGVLARSGLRTLLVDLDPQSHCAAGLGIPEQRIELDIGDAMLAGRGGGFEYSRLIWRAGRNLDLAPSTMKLAGLEAARGGLADKPDKERRLAGVLAELADGYDIACIDCSPAIGLLTYNALAAATCVLVPVETGFFSLQGATKQVTTVKTLGGRLGVHVPTWLLPTIHDPESELAADLLDELKRRFTDKVVPTLIRRDVKLKEAASFGQPIVEYAPDSLGATDYIRLGEWVSRQLALTASRGGSPSRLNIAPTTLDQNNDYGQVRVTTDGSTEAALAQRVRMSRPLPVRELAVHSTEAFGSIASSMNPHGTSTGYSGGAATMAPHVTPGLRPSGEMRPGILSRAEEIALRAQRMSRPAGRTAAVELPVQTQPAVPEPMLAPSGRSYGVKVTDQGVLFTQPISVGQRASIAGDFNGWVAVSHTMIRNEAMGVFELLVTLPKGTHCYRVVVDGLWSADPFNNDFELNPFGETNSVARVLENPQ